MAFLIPVTMLDQNDKTIIDASVLCWLATSDSAGVPNVSPKEMWYIRKDVQIVIANVASPGSARNVKSNPKVCVAFLDIFRQKGLQLKGDAVLLTSKDAQYQDYAGPLNDMSGGRYPFNSVFLVDISQKKNILAPSYILYPDESTEQSRIEDAVNSYKVRDFI